jgi:hypothetical protein
MPRQLLSAGAHKRRTSPRKAAKKSPPKRAKRSSRKPAKKSTRKPAKRSSRKSPKKSGKKMEHNEFYSMHEKRRVTSDRFWVKKIQTKAGARYQAIAFDPQDRKLHKFVSRDFYDKHKKRTRM